MKHIELNALALRVFDTYHDGASVSFCRQVHSPVRGACCSYEDAVPCEALSVSIERALKSGGVVRGKTEELEVERLQMLAIM
jgi:hypothetical protein